MSQFNLVLIYSGRQIMDTQVGPYPESVEKLTNLFKLIYKDVIPLNGGMSLVTRLKMVSPKSTLLVIPSGESTKLDEALSQGEIQMIQATVEQGLSLLAVGGAAYWASKTRIWSDMCAHQPDCRDPIIKSSKCPIFPGVAKGPLLPFPGQSYDPAFFRGAATIECEGKKIHIPLKASGTFEFESSQKIKVLAGYVEKNQLNAKRQPAIIGCSFGTGKAVLSMVQLGYHPDDLDVKAHKNAFPNSEIDWQDAKNSISPIQDQKAFLQSILNYFNSSDSSAHDVVAGK